jgi:hypothetical protein
LDSEEREMKKNVMLTPLAHLDETTGNDLDIRAGRVGAGETAMDRKFAFHSHRRHGAQEQHRRVAA